MTLFLLITWAILLGVLLRDLYRTEQPTREDVPSDNTSVDTSDDGLVGATRTVLLVPGRGIDRSPSLGNV